MEQHAVIHPPRHPGIKVSAIFLRFGVSVNFLPLIFRRPFFAAVRGSSLRRFFFDSLGILLLWAW